MQRFDTGVWRRQRRWGSNRRPPCVGPFAVPSALGPQGLLDVVVRYQPPLNLTTSLWAATAAAAGRRRAGRVRVSAAGGGGGVQVAGQRQGVRPLNSGRIICCF